MIQLQLVIYLRSDIINITNENIDISNIEIFDISSNLIELK